MTTETTAPSSVAYRLYVIELGRFVGVTPEPTVYVGSTRKSPAARLAEHLRGGFTAARRVTRYGTRSDEPAGQHMLACGF